MAAPVFTTASESEAQLLDSIHSGDRRALRRFYDRYAGYAMAVALRYMADSERAKDVVQDSFVKMLTSVGRFEYRGEGSLKAWAMRIVVNESITALRHTIPTVDITVASREVEPMNGDEPPDVERVPPDVLTTLIGQLPTGYRTVLNLFVFERKSHAEIGQLLGIKKDSSASQFTRAKVLLGRKINDYLRTGKI